MLTHTENSSVVTSPLKGLAFGDHSNLSRLAILEKIQQVFKNEEYQSILLINPLQFPEELLNIRIAKNKRDF